MLVKQILTILPSEWHFLVWLRCPEAHMRLTLDCLPHNQDLNRAGEAAAVAAVLLPVAAAEVAAAEAVVGAEDAEADKYSVRIRGISLHEAPQFA